MKEEANGNEQWRHHRAAPTTPAHAEGESGDREAREDAEAAVTRRAGDTGLAGAGGHRAKRQSPGTGREEQTRDQP
ncbi:hypothetical protein [Streptomyces tanashiensis]|uniref:Uncharacterized protein n=1 Tax=Streptomyces tanashiensis TaxID=67367 RepID=A0ABY6R7V9_9ACTN|nr:hypothetical protein [Streptomyces tanashiensis]UZX26165.1 hypothetical protein LDH80_38280 [Streptomyces tanashiensis]